ncbi:hypothetical protein J6590_105863, partial [Homalodisca vitripennis]
MTHMFKKIGKRAFRGAAKTGKRPRSLAVETTTKKIASTVEGLYEGHEDTSSALDPDPEFTPRIKALFLASVPDWATHAKKMKDLALYELKSQIETKDTRTLDPVKPIVYPISIDILVKAQRSQMETKDTRTLEHVKPIVYSIAIDILIILHKENKNEKSYIEQEIEEAALHDTDNINEDLLQLNQELRNEIESVNLIVTDMGKQLEVSRCAEKNLRKQITSLETLLIEREEFITKLQNDRKQKESINVNNVSELYSTIVKVQTKNKEVRRNLPLLKPEQPTMCKNEFQALSESEVEESTSKINDH